MKIAMSFEGDYLILPADKAQPLIEALAHGALYQRKGWDDDGAEYQPSDKKKPKVIFVDDSQLTAQPEPLVALQKETETANRRWIEEYNKRTAAEKKAKELEEKLSAIEGIAA